MLNRVYEWLSRAKPLSNQEPHLPDNKTFKLILSLILEELIELAQSGGDDILKEFQQMLLDRGSSNLSANRSLIDYIDAITDLKVVIANGDYYAGLTKCADEAFNLVMDSNDTKFCYTLEDAKKSVEKYKGSAFYSIDDTGVYIIKRLSDDKILKGINYKEPQWNQLSVIATI
jgi:hypothetical protein